MYTITNAFLNLLSRPVTLKCKIAWRKSKVLNKKLHSLAIRVIFKRIIEFGELVWFF